MKVIPLELPGMLLLQFDVYHDARGYFQELWNPGRVEIPGIDKSFLQDNLASSHYRVLRGLHYQEPYPQAKLVMVLTGSVFDVAVDVRRDSPTFGRWIGTELKAGSGHALYIPEGFAHGYQVTSESAQVFYKCTEVYHPEAEHSLAWNDPSVGITWPIADPILSPKDSAAPYLVPNMQAEARLSRESLASSAG
jgi:dTDP-4-dehydrorhamnose 3,5-epimerase